MTEYKKILLVQTAFLGDAVLTTPLLRALKQTYPDADIDVMCIPETANIFKFNPHINELIVFDKRNYIKRILSIAGIIFKLKQKGYDLAVSGQISYTTSFIMLLSKIPVRLGFPRQKLMNMTIDLPKGLPIGIRYLQLMKALTNQEFSHQTELFWDKTTDEKAEHLLSTYRNSQEIVVGLAPGSIWKTKRWPAEYFSELLTLLDSKSIKVVLIGGPDEIELCKLISSNARAESLNLAGKLSILGSAAVIKKLNLLVTNDSAPLHLANAVETDVIAIFGPTVKKFGFFPFRAKDKVLEIHLACRPCGKHGGTKCPQKHFRCMKAITPDVVYKAVLNSLGL